MTRQRRPEPADALDALATAQRRAVLDKYCRLTGQGRPMFCSASAKQRARGQGGADGKPIFRDEESAENAARELEALGCRPMYVYECPRSKRGHHHLSTDKDRLPGREGNR